MVWMHAPDNTADHSPSCMMRWGKLRVGKKKTKRIRFEEPLRWRSGGFHGDESRWWRWDEMTVHKRCSLAMRSIHSVDAKDDGQYGLNRTAS